MRTRAWAAAALAVAALAAAGCGGDDGGGDAAEVPAATTAEATTAPATTAPATTAPASTAPATTAPAGAGTAAAGKEVFAAAPCAGCHAGLGTRAGFGPKLADQGLTKAFIRTTVVNGRGQMPAGLVEGQDLNDVVAYVYSLQ
ncbi:MAG: cytochrome c [Thermoleophilia bacterium]